MSPAVITTENIIINGYEISPLAYLRYADLSSADLSYSDLSYAYGYNADFSYANLNSSNLSGAVPVSYTHLRAHET